MARRSEQVSQCPERYAEQGLDRVLAQGRAAHAELFDGAPVGADDAAIRANRDDALQQCADQIGPLMDVQAHALAIVFRQPAVLDHARRHLHQRQGVMVVAAGVTGHIQHAQHVAARIQDGCSRAGQEVVGVQKVLVGMDQRGRLRHECRPHGIRALGRLRPVGTWTQGHLGGAAQKVIVTNGVDDDARGIGQEDHAFRLDDLLVQHGHHGRCVLMQPAVALQGEVQVSATNERVIRRLDARDAQRLTALVRIVDGGQMGIRQGGSCRAVSRAGAHLSTGAETHALSLLVIVWGNTVTRYPQTSAVTADAPGSRRTASTNATSLNLSSAVGGCATPRGGTVFQGANLNRICVRFQHRATSAS